MKLFLGEDTLKVRSPMCSIDSKSCFNVSLVVKLMQEHVVTFDDAGVNQFHAALHCRLGYSNKEVGTSSL